MQRKPFKKKVFRLKAVAKANPRAKATQRAKAEAKDPKAALITEDKD